MPTIDVHPPAPNRSGNAVTSALPQILSTPSGLAIVEIQGTVKTNEQQNNIAAPESSSIGKLTFPYYNQASAADDTSWQKRVYLHVGKHQRLTGEVKKLAKPIAVLRRRVTQDERDELEIAEIVYYKLLFAHRPEPVGGGGE